MDATDRLSLISADSNLTARQFVQSIMIDTTTLIRPKCTILRHYSTADSARLVTRKSTESPPQNVTVQSVHNEESKRYTQFKHINTTTRNTTIHESDNTKFPRETISGLPHRKKNPEFPNSNHLKSEWVKFNAPPDTIYVVSEVNIYTLESCTSPIQ